jgi:hypothetical protein
MSTRIYLLSFMMLLIGGLAIADEKEADSCLRDKIWSGYSEGWAVRTATTTTLKQDEHRVYLLTLYAGNEYKVQVCADKSSKNVDLVLHDVEGNEILRDEAIDREPILVYKPAETQTFYVAVYATELKDSESGVALAVTYR